MNKRLPQIKTIKLNIIAICILSITTLLFGLVLASSKSHAAGAATANTTVTVGAACSMTGVLDNAHDATLANGTYSGNTASYASGIGRTTLRAFCNDSNGFAIYAIGFTGDAYFGENHTKLIGVNTNEAIITGTATSGNTSNWAMKLEKVTDASASYHPEYLTIENSFDTYHAVPDTYAKVATYSATTDATLGVRLTTTYAAYVAAAQIADTYTGKVKYTLVHPASEVPLQPQPSTTGYINYYANTSTAVGTMGRQAATDGDTVTLFTSNFSRDGYGFAGWSDAYDYATNTNAHFYGPNEDITVPTGTTANGLSLYAVWVKSAGSMQQNGASVCSNLTPATYNPLDDTDESTWSITAGLSSVTALTDDRDGDTYAVARLTDGNCWMIENLRLADTHKEGASTVDTTLTTTNTNNPLNDGTKVTLKHNYSDTTTYTNLSATSNVVYDAGTAPNGWCTTYSAECDDQSRLRTDNTASRATYTTTDNMTSHNINLYSYGNYYNWYSATAGNGTYSKASGNVAGDLCPVSWHLPTGTGSGEFGLLSNSLGGYKNASGIAQYMSTSTTPTGAIMSQRLRHFPNNFVYSGLVVGASLDNRGSYGYFWSPTASTNSSAYLLSFFRSNVNPGTNSIVKHSGRTVRCMVAPNP